MAAFSAETLRQRLQALTPARHFRVAYSGGLDSHVLLHALAGLNGQGFFVRAIHVDHGLHPDSARWAAHCETQSRLLGVPCDTQRVRVSRDGRGLEAAARAARHRIFESLLDRGGVLLTAHHAQDQAETVLLRLLRGAGVEGLAAIRPQRPCGAGMLLRPLLGFSRAELRAYADANALDWLEDPSNADQSLDRNYLRHRVWPLLEERWPAAAPRLGAAAVHAEEASALLEALARQDLAEDWLANSLTLWRLRSLDDARRRNALRHWLRRRGVRPPGERRLAQGLADLLAAAEDTLPELRWDTFALRRYQQRLYLLPAELPAVPGEQGVGDVLSAVHWPGLGALSVEPVQGEGLAADALAGRRLCWRFRRGGERIRLAGRNHHSALKKLLQQMGLPPWARDRLPLLYADDELIAVADLWVAEGAQARPGQGGLRLRWRPSWCEPLA